MKQNRRLKEKVFKVIAIINSHHTGAYAAQAAYFFVLSLIPIILLLMTLVQYTPITMTAVMDALSQVFPSSVEGMIRSIVTQAYAQSGSVISVTILVALWSAGKGVLSVTSGLNCVYENIETRNYIYLRIRASFYTVLFILAIVLSLLLSVFGNSISAIVNEHAPFPSYNGFYHPDSYGRDAGCADLLLGYCIPFPPQPEKPPEDNSEAAASGSGIYCLRMASDLVFVFRVSGYFYRIFEYVRKYDDIDPDHVVAVYVYVCDPAWR